MFCGKCGTKINDGDSYCTNCGAKAVKQSKRRKAELNNENEESNVTHEKTELSKQIKKVKCVDEYDKDVGTEMMEAVKFGSYEQSINKTNKTEPIEWLVLCKDEKNSKALLISKYGLYDDNYDEEYRDFSGYEYVNWEECPLRKRLNEYFINKAFTIEEREQIIDSNIINTGYKEYTSRDGNDTVDKIFLLSGDEAKKFFVSNKQRICFRAYDNNSICGWWIRTTIDGISRGIEEKGNLSRGEFTPYFTYSVRPAMWVKYK